MHDGEITCNHWTVTATLGHDLITGNHDRRHLVNKATSAALASPTTKDGQRSGSPDGSVGIGSC